METLEGDLCDYESLSTLKVVNLSSTSIQSLPPSVSKLTSLVNLTLQECSMLVELPPEIGRLKNLKMFDLEGTELMYLPKEMGNLEILECLRVSLCTYADQYKDSNGIEYIIPRTLILNFKKLEELSIGINPDAKWWEVELVEAILGNLHMLSCLKTLKLYFPTAKELRYLLRHENIQPPMYSRLRDFRLKVGHTEQQLASCLPSQIVEGFDQLEKCLKYENGEASLDEIEGLTGHANALFMRRLWTLEKLSIYDISELKYCLVAECNEMHTIVDARDVYGKGSTFNHDKKFAFDSVEYLAIYSMKKLKSIWKGPILGNSFTLLQVLALHTCPDLIIVFTEGMLNKLNRLTVLIVEDCPKVKTLVSREDTSTRKSYGPYLPKLKTILLLDLPELVSISTGVCIASQLDTLIVFNCLKFGDLNCSGLSNDVRKIIGENEWWDALKGRRSIHSRAFLPLKRDGDLMNRLSEDTNSLKQFLKLPYQG
ncbi:disease resistance protein At4g27190-like [Rutidosis leptorrhynchoides]|uniref:disease resistance protein At4g27190-like n=1 Tax=Rutidosis leptorrhynchoides TaxID=125765 RepID=UPI003A993CB6